MKKLAIVDLSSFIFRAYYAVTPLTSPKGVPVNAVYGVLSMLLKLLEQVRPTHLFIARDTKAPSFRKQLYDAYKANRTEPPDDLKPQFQLIDELVTHLGFAQMALDGMEADDLIGSAVIKWKSEFDEICIITGDKDLMQFVGGNIMMMDTKIDKIYREAEVLEKMGVYPHQIVDYLSIVGDSSDNIPGVKGIGIKGASDLIKKYGTLETILEKRSEITNKRAFQALELYHADALLSKQLAQIKVDVPLPFTWEQLRVVFQSSEKLQEFLTELGIKTLLKKVVDLYGKNAIATAVPPIVNGENKTLNLNLNLNHSHNANKEKLVLEKITELTDIKKQLAAHKGHLYFWVNLQGDQFAELELKEGIFSFDLSHFYYVEKLAVTSVFAALVQRGVEGDVTLVGKDVKKLLDVLDFGDNELSFFDFHLIQYLLQGMADKSFPVLVGKFLPDHNLDQKEVVLIKFDHLNSAESEQNIQQLLTGVELEGETAGEEQSKHHNQLQEETKYISLMQTLKEEMEKSLKSWRLDKLYEHIEAPLTLVLSRMEKCGIALNIPYFHDFELELKSKIVALENEVEALAGERINLRSPKQVGQLLFERLGLPVIKENKTGYSTDSEVLDELVSQNLSPIPALLLRHRETEKLLSTYVSVLPLMVNKKTQRLHTFFNQTQAVTGRLSSDKPNLQNIPIRTELGKRVRKGFVASPGKLLLSADYSQVELRILAHFSQDPTMMAAFKNDEDIHRQTAAEILRLPPEKVTGAQRNEAKAVNFGLMYGQSSFGLSKQLRISRQQAKEYIQMYFERFHRVKAFLDELKERAVNVGHAETLFGRKRFLPELKAQNKMLKAGAERLAINTPIQGTAADIIKVAMIRIDELIREKKLNAKMLLQVHDELIFETDEESFEALKELVRTSMENAAELSVPLKVDMGYGVNWLELKD